MKTFYVDIVDSFGDEMRLSIKAENLALVEQKTKEKLKYYDFNETDFAIKNIEEYFINFKGVSCQ